MTSALVTVGKPQRYYVFVIPVNAELNLKKAAAAVGEKSVSMIPQRDLLPLTGYVHAACQPHTQWSLTSGSHDFSWRPLGTFLVASRSGF